MGKEKQVGRSQYGDIVGRLQEIVTALEGGELSLEDSLDRFQEGMTLVKQGEAILSEADRRIEQLVSDDGRTTPLKVADAPAASAGPSKRSTTAAVRAPAEEDDVPF